MFLRILAAPIGLACVLLLTACHNQSAPPPAAPPGALSRPVSATAAAFYADDFALRPTAAALSSLGRELFADESLSASGKMSCATCHDPRFAYAPSNHLAVQHGGGDLHRAGLRAVPSLRYIQNVPQFSEHHFDEATDESVDQGPTGGHNWDGRADSVHDQARLPLLSPLEMANESPDAVVAKVRSRHAAAFREAFGDNVFEDPARAFKAILLSLEVFQQSPADFYPYDSKFDAWLRGRTALSKQELRGFALFNDPQKGNCASCHPSQIRQGNFPQFTDFGYAALGVPRNPAIPANADAAYHDLGLCGPQRVDLQQHPEYCGLFRVPTLRNVGVRQVFFHNGVFRTLRQVVEFYAQREQQPRKWYRPVHGAAPVPDDLPAAYLGNINREAPFDRKLGQAAALSSQEIDAVVVFLRTLTDGFVPHG